MNIDAATDNTNTEANLGGVVTTLLKGVLYQDADAKRWNELLQLQSRVRDYVAVLGLELMLDEAEGYAFLRSQETEDSATDGSRDKPRLMARRQLSFPVSLLIALLRKKLAEFDAMGGDTRLVLSRDDIDDLMRLFLPESSNEAKLVEKIGQHIQKVVDLGFLRPLKATRAQQNSYEVRRIIKAFVDAQWLAEFDQRLEQYRQTMLAREQATQ